MAVSSSALGHDSDSRREDQVVVVPVRRFAVFVHFSGATPATDEMAKLAAARSMHIEVVSNDPLKVSAVVTAASLVKAITAVTHEVSRVCPSADATSTNAIEVELSHPSGDVGAFQAS
jgi:hypothetical protein